MSTKPVIIALSAAIAIVVASIWLLRPPSASTALQPQSVLDVDAASISLEDLLTHTHGIENNGPLTFRSAYSGEHNGAPIAETLVEHGPASSGRTFSYGNVGYNLAGLVVDRALGRTWKELVETRK